jgi:hypothetical protein
LTPSELDWLEREGEELQRDYRGIRTAALSGRDSDGTTCDELSTLRRSVSLAVLHAERCGEDPWRATEAFREISLLEERIAALTSAADVEGAEARELAVRAANDAGQFLRALSLAVRFLQDPGAPNPLCVALDALRAVAEEKLADPEAEVRSVPFYFAA